MKKIFKIFLPLLIFSFFFVPPSGANAADLEISCSGSGTCTPASSPALFPSSEVWYPGKSLNKTVKIANISGGRQNIGAQATKFSPTGDLETVLSLSIVRVSKGNVVWGGDLNQFYNAEEVNLGIFESLGFEEYRFTVAMDQNAGNNFQEKKTKFDLILGFLGGVPPTPTPTLTPTPSPTPPTGATSTPMPGATTPGPTASSTSVSGGVLGVGVSEPVCSDTPPGGAPTLLSVTAGVNSLALTWNEAPDPVSYYLIAYGTSSGNYQFGNPNIGGKGTTSYSVSNLSGGTTYYFVVRAGNGCSPGPFSNELSAKPTGRFVTGPPAGFAAGVLGIETKEGEIMSGATGTPHAPPEVLGEEVVEQVLKLGRGRILAGVGVIIIGGILGYYFYHRRLS